MVQGDRTKAKDWREEVSNNLEYFLDTEEGRHLLAEMIRAEKAFILEQIKGRQRVKEVIWHSAYCSRCHFFDCERRATRCQKFDARIVKPFYGRPLWTFTKTLEGKEWFIADLDWSSKRLEIPDVVVEKAIKMINNGLPYSCFEPLA